MRMMYIDFLIYAMRLFTLLICLIILHAKALNVNFSQSSLEWTQAIQIL